LIPVTAQPEPADFGASVRAPGQAFLRNVPHPTDAQFKKNNHWKHALPSLKTAYRSVCAYSSLWMPGACTVDHFQPKSSHPHLAYEWGNYRLAHGTINRNKGDSIDVLDPFHIQAGWFVLDFATLWVRPEPSSQAAIQAAVQRSIDILKLNDDMWVQIRFELFRCYRTGECTLAYLQRMYPFIGSEISRQGV
jgi:hypothetical protein